MVSTETETPTFFLITSSGPAADYQSNELGLYRITEQMTDGRNVYMQENDMKYGGSPCKLFTDEGVWVVTCDGKEHLRATAPSDSPTSVKWQFKESDKNTWRDDPALTVTGLNEKPSECEVTISLSQDILWNIKDTGVAGVYRATGSYCRGRPVLQHSGGLFTLSVYGRWVVESGVGTALHLSSGSAPSQCPADPRAARNVRRGWTHWAYRSKQWQWRESSGISVKCDKCINVTDAITKIPGLESTVKTLKAEIEKLCSLNVTLDGSIAENRVESADWMKKYENENCLRTEETDVLKTQLKEMTGEVNEITAKFLNSERVNADLATQLKEMTDLYENSERSNADIATKLKEMTNLYKKADRDSKEHANEIVKISCEAGRHKKASKTLTNDKGVLIDEVKSPKIDLDALKKRIANMDRDNHELNQRAEKAWSTINQLKSRENVFTAVSVSVKATEVVKKTINKIDDGSA